MDPTTIMIPAAIPPGLMGAFLPAALFGVWTGVVLAVLATLSAVLGMESTRPPGRAASDDSVPRRHADGERAAA
jgi:uncharacterized membrane protein YdjX (TVP38/TMEM64 family)